MLYDCVVFFRVPVHLNCGWPIVRWSHSFQSPTLKSIREDFDFKPEYSLPNPLVESETSIGCLANSPLRLGNLNRNLKKLKWTGTLTKT